MLVIVCEICPKFLGYVRDAKKLFCDEFYDGRCRFSVESEISRTFGGFHKKLQEAKFNSK
jgi:hypothetical protein